VLACSVPEYTIYFDARIAFFQEKRQPRLDRQKHCSIADGLAHIFPDESRQDFYNLIRKAKKREDVKLYKNLSITISCKRLKNYHCFARSISWWTHRFGREQ
jgi:hypothetical protein